MVVVGYKVNVSFCPFRASFPLIIQTTGRCPGLCAHWLYRPFEYKYTRETQNKNKKTHKLKKSQTHILKNS